MRCYWFCWILLHVSLEEEENVMHDVKWYFIWRLCRIGKLVYFPISVLKYIFNFFIQCHKILGISYQQCLWCQGYFTWRLWKTGKLVYLVKRCMYLYIFLIYFFNLPKKSVKFCKILGTYVWIFRNSLLLHFRLCSFLKNHFYLLHRHVRQVPIWSRWCGYLRKIRIQKTNYSSFGILEIQMTLFQHLNVILSPL